eukprot:5748612-Pyramimonas_sp.AAC.1
MGIRKPGYVCHHHSPLPPAKRANSTEDFTCIHRRNQKGGKTSTGTSAVWRGSRSQPRSMAASVQDLTLFEMRSSCALTPDPIHSHNGLAHTGVYTRAVHVNRSPT